MRLTVPLLAALFAVPLATVALACSPQYPENGLAGRAAELEFSNRSTASGSHEYWAAKNAQLIMYAAYASETDEYDHNILGRVQDTKGLTIHIRKPGSSKISCPSEITLPPGQVFEDIAPHLADLTGDGLPEVITVQSDVKLGARLAIYDRRARFVAATPYIGRSHRWLAQIGAADLDGDGKTEIAYIDRPHLAKILRIWRLEDGALTHVADAPGLTNHQIGEDFISGGIRTCAGHAEIITANANRTRLIASTFNGTHITSHDIGPLTGPVSFTAAMRCK